MLMQGDLAKQLATEIKNMRQVKPAAMLGRQCNLLGGSSSSNDRSRLHSFWVMYHNASHPLLPHDNVYGLRLAGHSRRTRRRERTNCKDLDMSDLSTALAPDSFYQTLMSEHAGIIGLGLWLEQLARARGGSSGSSWIGSASWKHAIKNRPVPCRLMNDFNFSRLDDDHLVYWGWQTGPVVDWDKFQEGTAKQQVDKKDLMKETQDWFFREVFDEPPTPGLGAGMKSQGGAAHPWSNYIIVSRRAMINLAKFNVIQAAWLDMRYPRSGTIKRSKHKECPVGYRKLRNEGVVSTGAINQQNDNCAYCKAPVWTNWHRCRMGCHRCWSYVMEQLNIFYYMYVLKPVYVHDDTKCSDPFFWEKQSTLLHNFNMNFIDEVFELMLSK